MRLLCLVKLMLDGRFSVRGTVDDLEAGGVLSLTRASVRDVPLELRIVIFQF